MCRSRDHSDRELIDLADRARQTLARITNAALATVSPDGRPWNSPLYVAFDENLHCYWSSYRDADHSQNIAVNPEVLLVVFDSIAADESGHAVYLRATARELVDEPAIRRALECLANRRHEPPKPVDEFMGAHARRVYAAVPSATWTNVVKEANGHVYDVRVPVDLRAKT